jgi:hypothetical protein
MTFDYKISVWHNNYTIIESKISDSPVIQILSSADFKNMLVFHENGFAHLLDDNLRVLDSYMLSEHGLSCVEEVVPRKRMRSILVADTQGNLFSFNSSLEGKKLVKKTPTPITAIVDLGDKRILVSYYDDNNTTRLEMITPLSGNHLSSLKLVGTQRIVDFACPSAFKGLKEGWLLAASDQSIIEVGFLGHQLRTKSINHANRDFYIDEIYCDAIEQAIAGKELYPENGPIYEDVQYVTDLDEKRSTISDRFGARIITEGNHLYVKYRSEEINLHVEFDECVSFCKHLHWPEGRIILSGNDSTLRIVDWRSNCSRFFFDM